MGKKQKPGKPAKSQKPGKGAAKKNPGLSEAGKPSEGQILPNEGSEPPQQAQKGRAASKYLVNLPGATKDQPLPDEARGKVAGLVNLGNTCYMNSCVQVILSVPVLREYFKEAAAYKRQYFGIGNGLEQLFTSTYGGEDALTEANLKKGKNFRAVTLRPDRLYGAVCQCAPQFKGRRQQDSHELLRIVVDGLRDENDKAQKQTSQQGAWGAGQATANAGQGIKTFVESVFEGQLSSCVRCCTCGRESVTVEPFMDLSLPIPSPAQPTSPEGHQTEAGSEHEGRLHQKGKPAQALDGGPRKLTDKQRKRAEKKAKQAGRAVDGVGKGSVGQLKGGTSAIVESSSENGRSSQLAPCAANPTPWQGASHPAAADGEPPQLTRLQVCSGLSKLRRGCDGGLPPDGGHMPFCHALGGISSGSPAAPGVLRAVFEDTERACLLGGADSPTSPSSPLDNLDSDHYYEDAVASELGEDTSYDDSRYGKPLQASSTWPGCFDPDSRYGKPLQASSSAPPPSQSDPGSATKDEGSGRATPVVFLHVPSMPLPILMGWGGLPMDSGLPMDFGIPMDTPSSSRTSRSTARAQARPVRTNRLVFTDDIDSLYAAKSGSSIPQRPARRTALCSPEEAAFPKPSVDDDDDDDDQQVGKEGFQGGQKIEDVSIVDSPAQLESRTLVPMMVIKVPETGPPHALEDLSSTEQRPGAIASSSVPIESSAPSPTGDATSHISIVCPAPAPEITLETCLASFFAPEEISYACPNQEVVHEPMLDIHSASSGTGLDAALATPPPLPSLPVGDGEQPRPPRVKPLNLSKVNRSPSAVDLVGVLKKSPSSLTMRRSVSFSGEKPAVKYIQGSAEQRGTNFRAAMTGRDSFRRLLKVKGGTVQVKAKVAGYDRDQLLLCLSHFEGSPTILRSVQDVAMVEIDPIQDPSDDEEQLAVCLKANLLMNCVADMYEHEGEEGLRRMADQDLELVEQTTQPGQYLVRAQVGSSYWEYPASLSSEMTPRSTMFTPRVCKPLEDVEEALSPEVSTTSSEPPTLTSVSPEGQSPASPTPSPTAGSELADVEVGDLGTAEAAQRSRGIPDAGMSPFLARLEAVSDTPSIAQAEHLEHPTGVALAMPGDGQGRLRQVQLGSGETESGKVDTSSVSSCGEQDVTEGPSDRELTSREGLVSVRGSNVDEDEAMERGQDGATKVSVKKGEAPLLTAASKRYLIHRAPPLLALHLKRFARNVRGSLEKIDGPVPFPFDLDLAPFLDPKGPDAGGAVYTLTGVVEHQGVMDSGHYIAYVQRGLDFRLEASKEEGSLPLAEGAVGRSGTGGLTHPCNGSSSARRDAAASTDASIPAGSGTSGSEAGGNALLGNSAAPYLPGGNVAESAREGKTGSENQECPSDPDPGAPDAKAGKAGGLATASSPLDVSKSEEAGACPEGSPPEEEGADWEALLEGEARLVPQRPSAIAKGGSANRADRHKPHEDVAATTLEMAPEKGRGKAKGRRVMMEVGQREAGGKQRPVVTEKAAPPVRNWEGARTVKSGDELAWYRVSDTHVARVTPEAVASCEAYILMYGRV